MTSIADVFNALFDGEELFETECELCHEKRQGKRYNKMEKPTDCIVIVLPRLTYNREIERTVKDNTPVQVGGDLMITCTGSEERITYRLLGCCQHIGPANR